MFILNLSKSRIFLILCLVFIIGIFIASLLPVGIIKNDLWWFGAMIGILTVLGILYLNMQAETRFIASFLLSLVGIILFAFWRYSLAIPLENTNNIWYYNNQKVSISGKIKAEPDIRENQVKYVVEIENFFETKKIVKGNVLVTTDLYPSLAYGDNVKINCYIKKPKQFDEFAYDRYLARYNIYSVCYFPQIEKIKNTQNSISDNFYAKIFWLKDGFRRIIDGGLVEPEASLARGMILGDQKGLPPDLRQNFAKTGLSHIVAISGMNITMLSVWFLWVFLFFSFWRKQAFYLSVLLIALYIILIGAPVSAVRAGVMSFLFLWAIELGRLARLENSLVFAGALMILINPRILRDDVGFQLSFLALLGVIYCYPVINNWLDRIRMPKMLGARDLLSLTLAAQLTTIPIMTNNFSQISIVAPISNLLVLWTLAPIMILIFLAVGLAWIFPAFSLIIFIPAQAFLGYVIWAVNFTAEFSNASLEVGKMNWFFVLLYYSILYLLITRQKNDKKLADQS